MTKNIITPNKDTFHVFNIRAMHEHIHILVVKVTIYSMLSYIVMLLKFEVSYTPERFNLMLDLSYEQTVLKLLYSLTHPTKKGPGSARHSNKLCLNLQYIQYKCTA